MSDYYKFKPDQNVLMLGYLEMIIPAKVISRYTSDQHNHSARPHKRYVIVYTQTVKGKSYDDVSEGELE